MKRKSAVRGNRQVGYLGWRHNSIFGGGIKALQLAGYPHNTQSAMDHLPSSIINADQHPQDAPFVDERSRYLRHCADYGASPSALRIKRNKLLCIARRLGPNADQGVGMPEFLPIAQERQNLHGEATAAQRIIDIGRPWLRFFG